MLGLKTFLNNLLKRSCMEKEVYRAMLVDEPTVVCVKRVKSHKYNTLFNDIDRVVKEKRLYLKNDVSINTISKEIGTNRTYVFRAFSHGANLSYKSYIKSLWLNHAKSLLKDVNMSF